MRSPICLQITIASAVALAAIPFGAKASQIPPFFINSVVALGGDRLVQVPGSPDRIEWQTAGTGFFYGYLVENDPDQAKRKYQVYLVTAKHVIQRYLTETHGEVKVRINPRNAQLRFKNFQLQTTLGLAKARGFFTPIARLISRPS
jgi:hypothetical protein